VLWLLHSRVVNQTANAKREASHPGLSSATNPSKPDLFLLFLNGASLYCCLANCCELPVPRGYVTLILSFDGEPRTQASRFHKHFVPSALKLVPMLQSMKQQVIESTVVFYGKKAECK
jgi:hypothetical protein